MRSRLPFTILVVVWVSSCAPSFDVPLERLDEQVIQASDIEVHWWTTSSITTIHEHVEVVKGGEAVKIAELNAGGIQSIEVGHDTIMIRSRGGLFYQLDDSVFGYRIWLDTIPEN